MYSGIADTINRHVARLITAHLDFIDREVRAMPELTELPYPKGGWQFSAMADTLMGENDTSDGERAWFIGMLAARTPDVEFDGHPADADWENLFSHFRAEILARRDPETPCAVSASPGAACGVGSR